MTRFRLAFVWMVCCALAVSATGTSHHELAREVVEALGADQRAVDLMRSQAEDAYKTQNMTRAQRDCVLLVGREEFTRNLASIASRALTVEEMRTALAYFRSDVGKKHLEAIAEHENETARDWRQRRAFLDTKSGYLLMTRALLTKSDEATRAVWGIIRRRFQDCKKATDASPQAQPDRGAAPNTTS